MPVLTFIINWGPTNSHFPHVHFLFQDSPAGYHLIQPPCFSLAPVSHDSFLDFPGSWGLWKFWVGLVRCCTEQPFVSVCLILFAQTSSRHHLCVGREKQSLFCVDIGKHESKDKHVLWSLGCWKVIDVPWKACWWMRLHSQSVESNQLLLGLS